MDWSDLLAMTTVSTGNWYIFVYELTNFKYYKYIFVFFSIMHIPREINFRADRLTKCKSKWFLFSHVNLSFFDWLSLENNHFRLFNVWSSRKKIK